MPHKWNVKADEWKTAEVIVLVERSIEGKEINALECVNRVHSGGLGKKHFSSNMWHY